ncbi:MAG: hypothetical protein V4572_10325 [Bacteroidota bacterium]
MTKIFIRNFIVYEKNNSTLYWTYQGDFAVDFQHCEWVFAICLRMHQEAGAFHSQEHKQHYSVPNIFGCSERSSIIFSEQDIQSIKTET